MIASQRQARYHMRDCMITTYHSKHLSLLLSCVLPHTDCCNGHKQVKHPARRFSSDLNAQICTAAAVTKQCHKSEIIMAYLENWESARVVLKGSFHVKKKMVKRTFGNSWEPDIATDFENDRRLRQM